MPLIELDRDHEFNVSAELYHQSKLAGLDLRLEVWGPSQFHRSGRFCIDAVFVFDNGPLAAVEVKPERKRRKRAPRGSRQFRAYSGLWFPWRYCYGVKDVPEVVDWAVALHEAMKKCAA